MAALNALKLLSQQSARSLPLISAFYQPDAPSSSVDAAPAGADDFDHDDDQLEVDHFVYPNTLQQFPLMQNVYTDQHVLAYHVVH